MTLIYVSIEHNILKLQNSKLSDFYSRRSSICAKNWQE